MSRHQKAPLRPLTADERKELTRLSRSLSAAAAEVERARALLAIADGATYTAAAHQVGRRHTETLSAWVSCMVPGFDGALFSLEWKDALWAKFYMGAPARRRQCVARSSIVKRA